MRSILVPVDFTELSTIALTTAEQLCEKMNTKIIILAMNKVPSLATLTKSENLYVSVHKNKEVKEKEELLSQFKENHDLYQETLHINTSDFVKTILNIIHEYTIDLVVMGAKVSTQSKLKGIFSNSLTEEISVKSPVPVLVVRNDNNHLTFKNVLFVSDFKGEQYLREIQHAQKLFSSTVHLLNVNLKGGEGESDALLSAEVSLQKHNIFDYHTHSVEAESVEQGVMKFLDKNFIDIIAIGTEGKDKLQRLLEDCPSMDLLNHVDKPTYIFPLHA
ncbi:universal stress protein [Algivirga pacifica]|uniref:Universal stress protein n=1 Tax=Algivirga pacifica TaxID=1162670 RepID=A0ABP9DBC9_9BACT